MHASAVATITEAAFAIVLSHVGSSVMLRFGKIETDAGRVGQRS
jgi:hypothetical protein